MMGMEEGSYVGEWPSILNDSRAALVGLCTEKSFPLNWCWPMVLTTRCFRKDWKLVAGGSRL